VTVYVDEFPAGWGKWTGGGHMLASNIDELHAMASRIGLRREWFQGDGTFPHYDVQRRKRALALQHGAVPIEIGDIPDDVLMRKRDGSGYEVRRERMERVRRRRAEREEAA
jgi:hypothetical protein